jgi:transcriptional regulator with PAS, ATPase and Fis domain
MSVETADATDDATRPTASARPGVVVVFSGTTPVFVPHAVGREPLLVGRAGLLSALPDDRLSRQHARIGRSANGWVVEDLDSRNGTFVDGERVSGEARIPSLRVVRAGETLIVPCDDVSRAFPPVVAGELVIGSAMSEAMAAVARAASANETLVICGETGTGKELAARRFHELGPHARGPFIAVNCAAIPDGLAERLLFGARRGAYSGAGADADGNMQAADGGVLFLDEAGDLDLSTQAKLLRVFETREVVPLGASVGRRVNLRVCLAMQEDPRDQVVGGRLRADLYHRIVPPEVTLPPLRARLDEIAQHVVHAVACAAPGLEVHARLVEACLLRHWPGNVRELRRHLRHAAVCATADGSDSVRVEDLAEDAGQPIELGPGDPGRTALPSRRRYVRWSKEITRDDLESALRTHGGNVSLAARALGMQRSQIYREMARLSIRPDDLRD